MGIRESVADFIDDWEMALYEELVTTAKTFMEGPKPGVDYGKLAAHMPEISASLEYAEESIFKLTRFQAGAHRQPPTRPR